MPKTVIPSGDSVAIGPYSPGAGAGGLFFLSGKAALDSNGSVIAPGDIQTPRFLASRVVDEEMQQEGGTLVRYGQSIEIARAVEFLVSENNTYITGQVLRVDGGKQIWPS